MVTLNTKLGHHVEQKYMGLTYVKIVLENPIKLLREEVELLVDTGSTLPWIPRKILEKIGAEPTGRKKFKTINGKVIERQVSFVKIRYGESEAIVEVVVAEEGDTPVLGVVALESMGYRVNPVTGELEYIGLLAL
ncbi:MAG: aspartyl protease family protein [Candidatus Caldarchaeales archaeon]